MIAAKPASPRSPHANGRSPGSSPQQSAQPLDVLGALWRYRWAVILPALLFGVIGFLVYLRTDETYRSSTRLMVESNRPPIFDAMTGEVVGGVPDIEVLEAQLYSDTVAQMAFNDPNMKPYQSLYDGSVEQFTEEVQLQLELEPEVTDIKNAQSLVTQMHFDSLSIEHCEAAIRAYSAALQQYYDQRHQSTQADLRDLIDTAIGDLHPKLVELEETYAEFRRDAPLSWDPEGKAINPFREQQQYLAKRRSEMYQQLRRDQTTLSSMESVAEQTKDPRIALDVMSQLLGVKVNAIGANRGPDPLVGDSLLAEIDLEKKLVPLIVAKNQNVAQFGPSHPTVKALDEELKATREELSRLVHQQADRITKLREEWYADMGDPVQQAAETVEAVLFSHRAKVEMLEAHISELDEQIASSKEEAAKLASFEQQNDQMLREIDRYHEMLRQLEDNMGRVELSEDESFTRVVELWKPTKAYLVGPSLLKMGGLGTLVGLLLGSGLALLLEKHANTFRDPDEISTLLGVPVLTHIPFFRPKRRKLKKGEVDPYKNLSSDLAVVHQPASMTSEAIRSLRTSVFFSTTGDDEGGKVIQVTSPLPADGKSTLASNLACSIAQSGKRVLEIDCDLRRPQLTDNFNCGDQLGLSNVLNGECDPMDAVHATPLPKLWTMPCGPIPSNPAEALSLPVMNELLDHLRDDYDYIILDTPPLLVVTDPSITATMADAVLLTVRVRRKCKPNTRESMTILNGVGANVLGVVINNSDEATSSDGFRGYGLYQYGRYASSYYRRNGQASSTSVAVTSEYSLRSTPSAAGASKPTVKNGSAAAKPAGPVQPRPNGGATLLEEPPRHNPHSGTDQPPLGPFQPPADDQHS